jgi:hypothetical protein
MNTFFRGVMREVTRTNASESLMTRIGGVATGEALFSLIFTLITIVIIAAVFIYIVVVVLAHI